MLPEWIRCQVPRVLNGLSESKASEIRILKSEGETFAQPVLSCPNEFFDPSQGLFTKSQKLGLTASNSSRFAHLRGGQRLPRPDGFPKRLIMRVRTGYARLCQWFARRNFSAYLLAVILPSGWAGAFARHLGMILVLNNSLQRTSYANRHIPAPRLRSLESSEV